MYTQWPRTDVDIISNAPRVALRSTLGYLILPRWGGGMMVHRTRSDGLLYQRDGRDRWFIERSPMVLCPNGAQGDTQGKVKHWSCQRSPIDASRRPSKRPAEGLIPSSERISPGTFQNTARQVPPTGLKPNCPCPMLQHQKSRTGGLDLSKSTTRLGNRSLWAFSSS